MGIAVHGLQLRALLLRQGGADGIDLRPLRHALEEAEARGVECLRAVAEAGAQHVVRIVRRAHVLALVRLGAIAALQLLSMNHLIRHALRRRTTLAPTWLLRRRQRQPCDEDKNLHAGPAKKKRRGVTKPRKKT